MSLLVCVLLLVWKGYLVCIFEKNYQIGGSLQVFSCDKMVFDIGVYYVGGLVDGENLNLFFCYLGILDKFWMEVFDFDGYDCIVMFDGIVYVYVIGYENFIGIFLVFFLEEVGNICVFCEKIQVVCCFFFLYNVEKVMDDVYFMYLEKLEEFVWDVLCFIIWNKWLIFVFLGSIFFFVGKKDFILFYVMVLILNSYIIGVYCFINGGLQIVIVLICELYKYDVVIEKYCEVVFVEFNE